MVGLAALLAAALIHELAHAYRLPSPPAPRQGPGAQTLVNDLREAAGADDTRASYDVIAAKSIFSPTRSEGAPVVTLAAPPPPKPYLVGVVLDGPRSLAYLEDPGSHRVLGYAIGDGVGGGRVEKITDEEVVITRADGPVEVLLHDPTKPALVVTAPRGPVPPPGSRVQPQVIPKFFRRPFPPGQHQ